MDNESFQRMVLERLDDLKEGQARLEGDVASLKEGQERIEDRLNELEAKNATRHLQIEAKLDRLIEDKKSIFETLGRHETEITTLKRKLG